MENLDNVHIAVKIIGVIFSLLIVFVIGIELYDEINPDIYVLAVILFIAALLQLLFNSYGFLKLFHERNIIIDKLYYR